MFNVYTLMIEKPTKEQIDLTQAWLEAVGIADLHYSQMFNRIEGVLSDGASLTFKAAGPWNLILGVAVESPINSELNRFNASLDRPNSRRTGDPSFEP